MSSTLGNLFKLTVWGESHSAAIGAVIEGVPAGSCIDIEELQHYVDRRKSGNNVYSTPRIEADIVEILSGIVDGIATGGSISCAVRNTNVVRKDYDNLRFIPRPSHADYPAFVKYGGCNDKSGGGQFSGRLTLPLTIAGGIATQMLKKLDITIKAFVSSIGNVNGSCYKRDNVQSLLSIENDGVDNNMLELISLTREAGDSVGGVIECIAINLPVGLGEPIYDSIESMVSRNLFGIPAVKGIEFGEGFGISVMKGSEANDEYTINNGKIITTTNYNGGICGGLTTGSPIMVRVAVKPTPSIAIEQDSVDLCNQENTKLKIRGRHDACIVPRAVVCVESAVAIAIVDALMMNNAKIK